MPGVIQQLEALDFSSLDDALSSVRGALDVEGELDLGALDVGTLVGDLGPLIEAVQELESDPASISDLAQAVLAELGDIVGLPEVDELHAVIEGLRHLATLATEVATVLSTDDGADLVDRLLTRVGQSLDLTTLIGDVVRRSADALGVDLPDPLEQAFADLADLGAGIDDPHQLAAVVLRSFGGLDVDEVGRITAGLTGSLAVIASAGDHGALEALVAAIDLRIGETIDALAVVDPAGDEVDALVDVVSSLSADVDRLAFTELPRFIDGLTTDLRTARNQLVELDLGTALEELRNRIPRPGIEPLEVLIDPLRQLAGGLGEVTAESVTAALADARAELTQFATVGVLGELLDGIEAAQRRLIRAIRALPLEAARDAVIVALHDVQAEILGFTGFDFLDDLVAPVRELVEPLRAFDASSIERAVQELVDTVNGVFSDFPIEDLRDAIDAVIDPLGAVLDEAAPLIEGVAAELETLVAQIDTIDFDAAGTAVLDALAEIRQQVQEALGTDAVPDALAAVIAGVASTLQAMDLGIELSGPFDEAIAVIDVDALLAPVTEIWDQLRAALLRATPEALIGELDPPFDQLLSRLDEISLAPLTDALNGLFGQLLSALRQADPRVLVQPLEAEFQLLLAELRGVLDPAPLFAPLRGAYDELQGLIASIDLEAAMDELLGGIADTPTMLTDAVGSELAGRQGGSGALLPQAGSDVFRFGDILRPFAALVAEIRGRLHALASGVVGEGMGLVVDATRGLRSLLDPSAGLAIRIVDALDERRSWFDPSSGSGPVAELRGRLQGLHAALDAAALDATARARVVAAVGPIRLDARLDLDAAVTAPAIAQLQQTNEAASPPGLGRSTRLLARELDDLLPDPLLRGAIDPRTAIGPFVDALFDAIDPAPIVGELDEIGEQISAKLSEFVDELSVGLLTLWDELIAGFGPLMPSSVAGRLQAVVAAVADELSALDPGVIEDEARAVVDAAVGLLGVHSPATVAAEVGAVFDAAIAIVEDLDPGALLGDLDPFAALRADLELLRPSVVLAPLVERAAVLTESLELIASIDLDIAGDLFGELRGAFSAALEGVEQEWEALLDELASLGGASANVSVGV